MSHTNILKKSRWSWTVMIVVMLLAAAALFWGTERVGSNGKRAVDLDVGSGATATPDWTMSPVQDYLLFASSVRDRNVQGADAEFMAEGLRKLAGALGALNIGGLDLTVDLRVAAEHVLLDPASTENIEVVRNGLVSAANALEAGRQRDAAALRQLAQSIRSDTRLLDQLATIHMFFRVSAEVMSPLSQER